MLGFLTTPYLLLGAAAALLPILIHLIRRNRAEIVHFAAMRFLPATPVRLIRYQKLKQILLLLLRILALLILGLAFARPYFSGDTAPVLLGRQPQAIAIVVDVSASMAAANHLAAAREAARQIIRRAAQNDRIWLIAAATISELLIENAEPAQAEAALSRLAQKQQVGNLREALLFADNLLSRSQLQRRVIHLVSDLQASNIVSANLVLSSNAECHPVAVKPAWQNVAMLGGTIVRSVQEFRDRSIASSGRKNNVNFRDAVYACRVRNFSTIDQVAEVKLYAGASSKVPIASRRVSIAAKTEQVVQFVESELMRSRISQRDSVFCFEVDAPADDLPADNRFYVVVQSEKKRRLLVLSGSSESAYFARQALNLPGSIYQSFEASPSTANQYRLEDFDAILVMNVVGFNREFGITLRQYVEQGGGLILTLGTPLQNDMYNNFLTGALPGKIMELVRPAESSRQSGTSPYATSLTVALTEIDFAHPIFKIFVDPSNGDPTAVQVSQYHRVEPHPTANRIAGFEDGAAALLERDVGKGKVLLWTTSLDPMGGNLPVRGIFVPLLYQWLNHVCRPEPPQTTTLVGEPLFLGEALATQKSKAKLSTMITFPDGSRRSFENLPAPVLTDTPQPGFYQVEQAKRTSWHAVNLDTRESDPSPMTAENLLARVTRPEEQAQSGLAGIFGISESSQRDAEKQYKLWRLGLWALLLLLFAEVWLANRTPR